MSTALLKRHHHRRIAFEGACNVRDLGGLRTTDGRLTRRGVVYRSDALATLSVADQGALAALGVKSIFDLRTADERGRNPNRLPVPPPTQHALGFIPEGNMDMFVGVNSGRWTPAQTRAAMLGQYERLILEHTGNLAGVYRGLLRAGSVPALVHCASGKDRTGIAIAVLLLAVGVAREEVIEDYVISNYQRRKVELFAEDAPADAVEEVMCASADYLETALAAADRRFGSFDDFLINGIGLSDLDRISLADLLVD
jgi:protein-tyrosine phosphatase